MTEKELLYVEDAIGHENTIIKVCEETVQYLTDENLISFMKDELTKHENTKQKLLEMLEVKSNGWSIVNG